MPKMWICKRKIDGGAAKSQPSGEAHTTVSTYGTRRYKNGYGHKDRGMREAIF